MKKTLPLIERLLMDGFFSDQKQAQAAVMAGEIYIDNMPAKAGQRVAHEAILTVKGRARFVGKGGVKLTAALERFKIDVTDRVCIDAGASTGGFTDCLVKHGARLVYAVDVGFGQLMGSLRQCPAVVNLEKTNIGDDKLLTLSPIPTLGTVDLSYLSLKKGIAAFARVMQKGGELICLVKPLFEVDDAVARRTGILPNDAYAPILFDLIQFVNALPYATAMNVTHSPVTGNAGTREFFLHVALQKQPAPNLSEAVHTAVQNVLTLKEYKK